MEKYDNLGMVGEGSYGMVMKCKHKETGQVVAIKKFLESEDDKMVKKIAMREVRMLRKLRHENLVNLIEVFRRRKRLYLVFEFVDHTVLDDLEKYPNGLSEMTVRKILWQVLRGVEFCHSHNIIHRDIKPENILNSRGGVIKICDFGFARSLAAHGEIYTDYVATRWYRAPELLVGDTKYGRPVDLWAVGCLVAEMLTGDPLFPGDSDIDQIYHIVKCFGNLSPRHREIFQRNPLFAGMRLPEVKEVEPLEKKFPRFSSEIIDLMRQCLRLDPNDRPSTSSLLRHEFFRKDNFEEKVIPEIRARIQKEYQHNQMVRKNLAEKQQKQQEDAENRRKKKMKESSGTKDQALATPPTKPQATPPNKPLATPPNKSQATPQNKPLPTPPSNLPGKPQNIIAKDSPRQDKNLPVKKSTNVDSTRKDSLAALKPQPDKTPPSDETKRKKDQDNKVGKLPVSIKQDNIVSGPSKQPSPQKQSTSKEDFSSPRTLIPKVTNESMVRPQEIPKSNSPFKDKSPRDGINFEIPQKLQDERKHVTISKDTELISEKLKLNKTPPLSKSPPLPKDPKPSILKKPGAKDSKERLSFEESVPKGNIKPNQELFTSSSGTNLPLTKSVSDTTVFRDKKMSKIDKQSVSNPPTPADLTPIKPQKSHREKSPKEGKTVTSQKAQKDGVLDRKERPLSSKMGSYKIPPIHSQTGPNQSPRSQNDLESPADTSKQFPTQGMKILEKTKKAATNKESFSPQTSYEKNMYGSTVSNFEKMMMTMSGATSISHPAIKKNSVGGGNQPGGGSNVSPYVQSSSPYSQQFGHHYQQHTRDEKTTASNPWSTTGQSYFDKHQSHRSSMVDPKGSEHEKKHHRTSDEKSHHHSRHHHKHEDKSTDDKQTKSLSKSHDDKVAVAYGTNAKRTRLPDLLGRGMGVSGISTSRPEEFLGFKQTGTEHQKRKFKSQKLGSMAAIPNIDSTQSMKPHNNTSPSDTMYHESNFPSVRRKL